MRLPSLQRRLLGFLGAALFFTPSLAGIAGVRVRPIENRPLAARPSIRDGWDAIDGVTPFANDHLPLRDRAIRVDTWFDETIFRDNPSSGQSSNPKVLVGDAGWLFLAEDLDNACNPAVPVREALANVSALHDLLSRYGKRLVFTVAPDKTTFMDDRLRSSPQLECARFFKAELWRLLATDPPKGYVDLRNLLEAERTNTGELLYRRLDTHWNKRAAVFATRAIADAFDPALWESSKVVRAQDMTVEDDLARMLGKRSQEQTPNFGLGRDVRRTVLAEQKSKVVDSPDAFHVTNQAKAEVPLVPGRTTYFYDSFGAVLFPFLSTLFVDIEGRSHLMTPPEMLTDRIADADTVIYEVVERHLVVQFGVLLDWGKIVADLESTLSDRAALNGTAP